jgi:DHA1 family multidrug resistance protein-like MFS transporter
MVDAQQYKENMWYECVRDSSFGHIVRLITKQRMFKFLDERNPEIWKTLVDEEKSGYMAHHGTTDPHGEDSDLEDAQGIGGVRTREDRWSLESKPPMGERENSSSSQDTRVENGARINHASGVKVDPEKGKDVHLIEFLENDPEVCTAPFSIGFY